MLSRVCKMDNSVSEKSRDFDLAAWRYRALTSSESGCSSPRPRGIAHDEQSAGRWAVTDDGCMMARATVLLFGAKAILAPGC